MTFKKSEKYVWKGQSSGYYCFLSIRVRDKIWTAFQNEFSGISLKPKCISLLKVDFFRSYKAAFVHNIIELGFSIPTRLRSSILYSQLHFRLFSYGKKISHGALVIFVNKRIRKGRMGTKILKNAFPPTRMDSSTLPVLQPQENVNSATHRCLELPQSCATRFLSVHHLLFGNPFGFFHDCFSSFWSAVTQSQCVVWLRSL